MMKILKNIHISGNLFYVILILVIGGGYLFFFNSKELFTQNKVTIQATSYNEGNAYKNRDFTLIRWDYSESDKICEIELDILNNNFDGENTYEAVAYVRSKGVEQELQVEKVIEENTLLILQIKDIPDQYAELCLKVSLPGEEEEEPLKLYATRDSVEPISDLSKRTREEYQMNRLKLQIRLYEEDIVLCKDEIHTSNENIKACKEQIKELKAEMKYQPDRQKEDTQKVIDAAYTEISRLESEIEKMNTEIKEVNKSIKQIKTKLED